LRRAGELGVVDCTTLGQCTTGCPEETVECTLKTAVVVAGSVSEVVSIRVGFAAAKESVLVTHAVVLADAVVLATAAVTAALKRVVPVVCT
jgi:hypothetical protein